MNSVFFRAAVAPHPVTYQVETGSPAGEVKKQQAKPRSISRNYDYS